jgi:hypothetical protein
MAPAGISRGTSLCPDDSLADPVTAVSDQGCLYGVRPRVQALHLVSALTICQMHLLTDWGRMTAFVHLMHALA